MFRVAPDPDSYDRRAHRFVAARGRTATFSVKPSGYVQFASYQSSMAVLTTFPE